VITEEVIGAKARFDPEKCQKEIFAPARRSFYSPLFWRTGGPAHFMCDRLVLFKAISARASPITIDCKYLLKLFHDVVEVIV